MPSAVSPDAKNRKDDFAWYTGTGRGAWLVIATSKMMSLGFLGVRK